MKYLIERENFINEFIRINKDTYDKNELYEGLLNTLFGGLKMLLKKDWSNIKCKNPSVLKHLQEIDKNLSGYTKTKMEFHNECNTIRQNIADYFNDILDYKLSQIEKEDNPNKFLKNENKEKENNKDAKGVEKELNLKDKSLLNSINKYKENINVACKESSKLREYADLMLNSVEVFVNDIIISELEKKGADKEKLEEERKKIEEEKKKNEEIRKKMDKNAKDAGEEALKKISKERDDNMRKLGVKPIGPMSGDKSVETIAKQFKEIIGEFNNGKLNESVLPGGYDKILNSDTYLGIQKSLEELNWNTSKNVKNSEAENKFFIRVILSKINAVFEVVEKNKKMFEYVPSVSVQAMMLALSSVIIYGFKGDEFNIEKNKERISLITKCAIDSDATIGFNLPLIDPKKPDNGNFFVAIMQQFKDSGINSKEIEDIINNTSNKEKIKILKSWGKYKKDAKDEDIISEFKEWEKSIVKTFRQNITKLFDIIIKKADSIKEKAKKERYAEAANAQSKSEANEKSN